MNAFLRAQLEKKIEKFFNGKSDMFVVEVNSWLTFGGCLQREPEIPKEDFEYLKTQLIGASTLDKWLAELKEPSQFFSRLSGSEQDLLQTLSHHFLVESHHRLRVVELKKKIAAHDKSIKAVNKKLAKIEREIKDDIDRLEDLVENATFNEK